MDIYIWTYETSNKRNHLIENNNRRIIALVFGNLINTFNYIGRQ